MSNSEWQVCWPKAASSPIGPQSLWHPREISLLAIFMTTFREGLEALLIISVAMAFLRQTDNHRLLRPLLTGAVVAVIVSAILGVYFGAYWSLVADLGGLAGTGSGGSDYHLRHSHGSSR